MVAVPPLHGHWIASAPSAVEPPETSAHIAECAETTRVGCVAARKASLKDQSSLSPPWQGH